MNAQQSSDAQVGLVVTEAARTLRRQLGPTAWTVLEDLVLDAAGRGAVAVETDVRRLAAAVGISKDSVARAVRRLIDHGVVGRRGGRDQLTGCFGRSVYELRPDAIVGVVVLARRPDGDRSAQGPRRDSDRRRTDARDVLQGSLFDPGGATVKAPERSAVGRDGNVGSATPGSADPGSAGSAGSAEGTRSASADRGKQERKEPGIGGGRDEGRRAGRGREDGAGAEAREGIRHWHPAVPGVRAGAPAAVPTAVGGGSC